MKNKGNYILLGVAISYFAIAFIQSQSANTLPAWLYVTIANVSLGVTILELLKTCLKLTINCVQRQNELIKSSKSLCERHITVFEKHKSTQKYANEYKKILLEKENDNENKIKKNNKIINYALKFEDIVIIFQSVYFTVQVLLTPLKSIPYNDDISKYINVSTILTFAFMFFSYFLTNLETAELSEMEGRTKLGNEYTTYYLDAIEKINEEINEKTIDA